MEILDTILGRTLIGILVAINLFAFLIMGRDKSKATRGHNAERASEWFMFFLATMFGSFGVYLGMLAFRHKTRKWYFQLGIPLLILQNVATLYVLWGMFSPI